MEVLAQQTKPLKGIAFAIISALLMTLNNAILKYLTVDLPVGQVITMRSTFLIIVPLWFFVWLNGGFASLKVKNWAMHLVRGAMVSARILFFTLGLAYLPLADAVVITFAGPLILTALAGPLLGENVGRRRWGAAIIGFVGILLIVRPESDSAGFAALLPLISAFLAAGRDIITRRMTEKESSTAVMATTFGLMIVIGLFTIPLGIITATIFESPTPVFGPWLMPSPFDLCVSFSGALLVAGGHYAMIEALRFAEASTIAPFNYTSIAWAVLAGYVVWGHLPNIFAVSGTCIVIMSGLYIMKFEYLRQSARQKI